MVKVAKPHQKQVRKKRGKKQKRRVCLRCDRVFFSVADRTCPGCQERNGNVAPGAEGYTETSSHPSMVNHNGR